MTNLRTLYFRFLHDQRSAGVSGLVSVLLSGAAQALVEQGHSSPVTGGLYLLAIAVFTLSASGLAIGERGVRPSSTFADLWPARNRLVAAALVTFVFAVVFVAMVQRVRIELTMPGVLLWPGPVLWIVSMVLLMAASVLASVPRTHAVWQTTRWPQSRNVSRSALFAVVVVLAAIVVARTVALDRVPLGILPDEGDRASTSISIIRGGFTGSMFSDGWYYISNVYFWLLSGVLHALGIGFVQARAFGAVTSILNAALVLWIVYRHFSLRAAIFTGALLSFLGISLQFARLTIEATQTALLWTISVACLLEVARRSQVWLWTVAGIAGGLSIYFYPTGRLWAVLGGVFAVYVIAKGESGTRIELMIGAALMVVAAAVAATPFLLNLAPDPTKFSLRAQQTSIFVQANLQRLPYYDPHWSTAHLLWVQVTRCVSLFSNLGDAGGFFPSGRPLAWGLLSVFTLIGIGWSSLTWRDSRLVLLSLWFWIGLSGAVVTVETPNVTRIGTAVPVVAIFSALVIDSLLRRAEAAMAALWRPKLETASNGIAGVLIAAVVWQQGFFYFHDYSTVNAWAASNLLGQAVNQQGSNTLVTALGHDSDMINWGWTRLLAPYVPRGAVQAPGSVLPLALPSTTNLAFALAPDQLPFAPYLRELYPGGTLRTYRSPVTGPVVTIYRITQRQWAARQGSIAQVGIGPASHVATLGTGPAFVPPGTRSIRWVANWRIPVYDDYGIRAGPGPALVTIDGRTVLTVPKGRSMGEVHLSLVRGDHHVAFTGPVSAKQSDRFESREEYPATQVSTAWQTVPSQALTPLLQSPGGLAGKTTFQKPGFVPQQRLDETIATCCLAAQVNSGGAPFTTVWTGFVHAATTGTYAMWFAAEGRISAKLDDHWLLRDVRSADYTAPATVSVHLQTGWHPIRVQFSVSAGSGGFEWRWKPPGGAVTIVPPSVLRPPPDAGVSGPLSSSQLGPPGWQPLDVPFVVKL